MDLDLLTGGQPLRGEVRAMLAGHRDPMSVDSGFGHPPGYDPELWADLARRGWLRLGFPAELGGRGRLGDLAVLLEELGRARAPSPIQCGLVQAGWAILGVGTPEHRARWLPALIEGTVRAALCVVGPAGHATPGQLGVACRTAGSRLVLDGVKRFVPYADSADLLLIVADGPGDGVSLGAVHRSAAGVSVLPAPSIAGDRQAEVTLQDVEVPADLVIGAPGGAWPGIERAMMLGAVAVCAEMVGASAALVERTAERARTREQFGRPIGSQQAVQHRCADMALDHLAARGAVQDAVRRLDDGRPAEVAVAAAKAVCGAACQRVAASAHQVWGGTGYLEDAGIHRWSRLVKGGEPMLGGSRAHTRRLAALLRDGGGWSTHPLD